MHSLWAASWLADIEGFDRQGVINQLFTMAIGISLGALLLGTLADRLRKRGIATEVLLVVFSALFMLAELALSSALAASIHSALVRRINHGGSYRAELCDHSGLLSDRNRRACQWRLEPAALRLGLRYPIRDRTHRGALGTPRWSLSGSRLSGRIHSQPRTSGGRVGVVRHALARKLLQKSLSLICAAATRCHIFPSTADAIDPGCLPEEGSASLAGAQ